MNTTQPNQDPTATPDAIRLTAENADPGAISRALTAQPTNAALATLVERVSSFLDSVEGELGPAPLLTPAQRRRASKPRRGAEKVLTLIAPIVREHGLDSAAVNADTMLAHLADAAALRALFIRLSKVHKRIDDELFTAQCGAWELGLQFYSLLRRRAKSDGTLATSIEPLRAMFRYQHPLVRKERPTKIQTRAKARLRRALAAPHEGHVAAPEAPTNEA